MSEFYDLTDLTPEQHAVLERAPETLRAIEAAHRHADAMLEEVAHLSNEEATDAIADSLPGWVAKGLAYAQVLLLTSDYLQEQVAAGELGPIPGRPGSYRPTKKDQGS